MKECCISQIKILKDRPLFAFSLLLVTLISAVSFLLNVVNNYGGYLPDTMAYRDLVVFCDRSSFWGVVVIILPIIAALPFSDSYLEDKNKNRLPVIFQLCTPRQYYFSKLLACALAGFAVLFIPMFLNLMFNVIAFPKESFANLMGTASFQNYLYSDTSEFMLYMPFKSLFISKPFVYCLIFIVFISACSAVGAVFSYSLSYFFRQRVFSYLPFFLVFNLTTIFSEYFLQRFGVILSFESYITPGKAYEGDVMNYALFFAMLAALVLVSLLLAPRNIKKLGDLV